MIVNATLGPSLGQLGRAPRKGFPCLLGPAVGQNLRYLFGVGYHPTIVFFKGVLGVHRGTRVLTHCRVAVGQRRGSFRVRLPPFQKFFAVGEWGF